MFQGRDEFASGPAAARGFHQDVVSVPVGKTPAWSGSPPSSGAGAGGPDLLRGMEPGQRAGPSPRYGAGGQDLRQGMAPGPAAGLLLCGGCGYMGVPDKVYSDPRYLSFDLVATMLGRRVTQGRSGRPRKKEEPESGDLFTSD